MAAKMTIFRFLIAPLTRLVHVYTLFPRPLLLLFLFLALQRGPPQASAGSDVTGKAWLMRGEGKKPGFSSSLENVTRDWKCKLQPRRRVIKKTLWQLKWLTLHF